MLEGFDLTGRTAVVTGGSEGLGYAMASALAAAGARTMLVGRRREALEEAAGRIEAETGAKGGMLVQAADLYDRADVDRLARDAIAATGGIDIFVGNAGAVHPELIGGITQEAMDQAVQLNLTSNIVLTQAFVPHMRQQRWGRIIFSSSTASHLVSPGRGNIVYAATKSGLNAYARTIAGDLGREGITVNNLIIGVFWTSILKGVVADMKAAGDDATATALVADYERMTALGRLGDPARDLSGIVQLLASDAGGYITGASIPMDGGTSIMMVPFPGA